MDVWLSFALLGLGTGAMYAAIGLGVVVVYRGSGVINFATSAIAIWGAFVCDEIRRTGDLVLPVILVPDRIPVGRHVVTAVVLGVASVAVLAGLISALAVRRLATAPVLARVIVTLGVMIVFLGLIPLKFGTAARVPASILPNDRWEIGSVTVPVDRLLLAILVLALALGLRVWFRRSRTGLAVSAASENEQAVAFAGYSPSRLGMVVWVLGLSLTSVVLILASPTRNLDVTIATLMIAPALAVALLGGMRSVVGVTAAGLGLGALQSCLTHATAQDWFPEWGRQGINDAVPFIVVVSVLFLLGKALPERGASRSDPLPPVVIPTVTAARVAALTALGVVVIAATSGGYRFGVITTLISIVIAASLVLLTGMVGQISVAQAALAGAAGFVLSRLGTGVPFPLNVLLASCAAAVLGVLIGVPALRIRGAQLAVVTLAAAVAIEQLVFRNPAISPLGGNVIAAPTLFGLDLSVRDGDNTATFRFGVLVLVIVVLAMVAVANLMRSATGRRLLAVRSNERAGASLGVDVSIVKLTVFAASSFLAGLGGALIGLSREQLSPNSFGVVAGLSILAFAYLGGITSISGAVLAGTFAPLGIGYVISSRLITPHLEGFRDYYSMLGGLGLVVSAVANPMGMAGAMRVKREEKRRRRLARGPGRVARLALPLTMVWERRQAASQVAAATAAAPAANTAPPPLPAAPGRALEVRGMTVRYGGVRAVGDVSLTVPPGRIVGLIGPNGAGKTSLIDGVTGYVPAAGTVRIGETDLSGLRPHERVVHGVVRTWQSVELFDELTVRQNVMVGAERTRSVVRSALLDVVRPTRATNTAAVDAALELMGLRDVEDRHPSELSLGRQKLLGVARALAMSPSIVLMDEPAAGLDSHESAVFGQTLRTIAATGIGILLVDHDMDLVFDVCDDVYVMDFGELLASGAPAQVRGDERVIEAYLGVPVVHA